MGQGGFAQHKRLRPFRLLPRARWAPTHLVQSTCRQNERPGPGARIRLRRLLVPTQYDLHSTRRLWPRFQPLPPTLPGR